MKSNFEQAQAKFLLLSAQNVYIPTHIASSVCSVSNECIISDYSCKYLFLGEEVPRLVDLSGEFLSKLLGCA